MGKITYTQSILTYIQDAVYAIEWSSTTKRDKAIQLCVALYDIYIYRGGDFHTYRELSHKWFDQIIKTKNYVKEIKDTLINSGIIERNNSYNVDKGTAKGYRFNKELLNGEYDVTLCSPKSTKNVSEHSPETTKFTLPSTFTTTIFISTLSDLYHYCYPKLETHVITGMQRMGFSPEIDDIIKSLRLTEEDIILNEDIPGTHVNVVFENGEYMYKKELAITFAKEQGLDLILHKGKGYVDDVNNFLYRKTDDLRKIYKRSVFDIRQGIFHTGRNNTNDRFDYNLTNMKAVLIDHIRIDGEPLIELDIANSQFAIFSYLIEGLDDDFIRHTQEGTLYTQISKQKMFRVAFDKVKKDFDDVRERFPRTMEFVDEFKRKNGYKAFSNLLQKTESKIMIDYVMSHLIDEGYTVFPIHDAFRVKESEVDQVQKRINELFQQIGFKCLLRNKRK